MPYAKDHKQKSRAKILAAARRIFKEQGFETVTIDDVMGAAGMTRGGFYAHFKSKGDLIAQTLLSEGMNPPTAWGADELLKFTGQYLSADHRDKPGDGCPAAALTQEVARSDDETRAAYTDFLRHFASVIDTYLENDAGKLSDDALAIMAQMVGAVQMARAVSDPMLSTRMLKAGRQAVEYLLPPDAA